MLQRLAQNPFHLRNAKSALFTAECRLVIANTSAAAANSRLAEAREAHNSARYSHAGLNSSSTLDEEVSRSLASDWFTATEVALEAAEKCQWVAAAEAEAAAVVEERHLGRGQR